MRATFQVVLGLAAAIAAAGCKRKPPEPPTEVRQLAPIEVTKDKRSLFTYVTPQGAFETVDDPATIPAEARRIVRAIDPDKAAPDRAESAQVYVIDADELLRAGKAKARVVSREAFESSALAQLPPGASSDRNEIPAGVDGGAEADAGPLAEGDPVVIVYGTSWCPACREARRYLTQRKIPHLEKDIERDPAAARELASKGAKLGVPTDRIPVLDVRGRLMIGFDKERLEAMLGQAI